jgi:hypothetical protein
MLRDADLASSVTDIFCFTLASGEAIFAMLSIPTPAFYDCILILAFILCRLFLMPLTFDRLGGRKGGDYEGGPFIQIGGNVARCADATQRARAGDRCVA